MAGRDGETSKGHNKRAREDGSQMAAGHNGAGPSKRTTRSTSQAQAQEAAIGAATIDDQQRIDTAASPERRNPSRAAPTDQQHQLLLLPERPAQDTSIMERIASVAQRHLDPGSHDRFLKGILADDQAAELAYRRGLLVTFNIGGISGAQGIQVEAPEFASVDYLKRRITKAKAISDEFCLPEKFALKRKPTPGAPHANREILETTPQGVPSLLFNLGFVAGQTYNLSLMSRRVPTSDKAQQDAMLQGAATGAGARIVPAQSPGVRAYQELLQGKPLPGARPAGAAALRTSPTSPAHGSVAIPGAVAAGGGGEYGSPPRPARLPTPQVPLPPGAGTPGRAGTINAPQTTPGGTVRSPRDKSTRGGRWTAEEINSLITGFEAYPGQWAKILEVYKGRGIDARRSSVDLKDKWRNLVKSASDTSGQRVPRGGQMDQNMITTILRLQHTYNREPPAA